MATQLNSKPVRELTRDMLVALNLQPGQTFTRQQAVQWFARHYPNVKPATVAAHLIRQSVNTPTRFQYSAKTDGSDDLFIKLDSSRFRPFERDQDAALVVANASPSSAVGSGIGAGIEDDLEEHDGEPVAGSSEFAYEHDLRDYLARNLHLIEPGLTLYNEQDVTGIEFPAGGRFIDILAVDRTGGYVVIELKVSKGYDRVVGQLLRYRTWIKKNHAEPGQNVRGVIVAKTITEDLKLACEDQTGVSLFEYALSVTLRAVPMGEQV